LMVIRFSIQHLRIRFFIFDFMTYFSA